MNGTAWLLRLCVWFTFFAVSLEMRAAGLEDLLKREQRPTMADIEDVMPQTPSNSPLLRDIFPDSEFRNRMPRVIAAFELSFPGATFYEVGRDVARLGDALDAFYRSIGQPDRVRRLDVSAPSFTNEKDTYDFLVQSGLDLSQIEKKPPFVFFDITFWSPTSQSRQLLRAGYSAYARMGGNLQRLYSKFNFIAVGFSLPNEFFNPSFSLEDFRARQRERVTADGPPFPIFVQAVPLAYGRGEWHGMFRPFVRTEGRVVSPAGDPYSEDSRMSVLKEMLGLRQLMQSTDMLKAVQKEARALGYEFPLQRVFSIQRSVNRSSPVPATPTPDVVTGSETLSPATEAIWKSLRQKMETDAASRSEIWAIFEDMCQSVERKSIPTSDLKIFLPRFFLILGTSKETLDHFEELYQREVGLRQAWRALTAEYKDAIAVPDFYRWANQRIQAFEKSCIKQLEASARNSQRKDEKS